MTYAGTDLECCFTETLARFRVDSKLPTDDVAREWAELHHMSLGSIPKDWRLRRLRARISLPSDAQFVDADHANTIKAIRLHYPEFLAEAGVIDLDRGDIAGKNRLITRWVSHLVNDFTDDAGEPAFAGLRYSSRIDRDLEVWAIFDRCPVDLETASPVVSTDDDLITAVKKLGLTLH